MGGQQSFGCVWHECAAGHRLTFRPSGRRFRRRLFPEACSQLQFRHDVLEAGFAAYRIFSGRSAGEIGHACGVVWGPYGYIYEKEWGRLAKIEKMAEALEKKLIFLPKNDSV